MRGSPSQHSMSTEFCKINWSNKHIRNENTASKLFNVGPFSQQTLLFIVDGIIYTENIKPSCFLSNAEKIPEVLYSSATLLIRSQDVLDENAELYYFNSHFNSLGPILTHILQII